MRKLALAALAVLLLALVAATPGGVRAQSEPLRQTGSLTFTELRPGTSSEVVLTADYVNPSDPAAKPPAVRRTEVTLPPGTRVDTSAPEACQASNGELMAVGEAACPLGSVVGHGSLTIDTGFAEPGRYFEVDVTLLNNRDELIFLSRERASGARVVARSQVEGRVIKNSVPVLPGTPPDGGAITRQELIRDEVTRTSGAQTRSYITTPPRCPRSGYWLSSVKFIYDDGVEQTLEARSPCKDEGEQSPSCRGRAATATGSERAERILGSKGSDVIVAGAGADRIRGRGGRDFICAGPGRDRVRAGAGNDRLFGGGGADRLFGRRGHDLLLGGLGADLLRGGAGRDRCPGPERC